MFNDKTTHLSDEQLCLLEDGALGPLEASHAASCPDCAKRLDELRAAVRAYAEYRATEKPPAPPKPWASIGELVERHKTRRSRWMWRWLPVPALAAACAVAFFVMTERAPVEQAEQLLDQSSAAEVSAARLIEVRLHGQRMVRPAVVSDAGAEAQAGYAEVRRAFLAANYSWSEPLSARSFQAWRRTLKTRSDFVSVVHVAGAGEAYRVRTDAPGNELQSASLFLRKRDLHAASAQFSFKQIGAVDIGEVPAASVAQPAAPRPLARDAGVVETPAGPVDTLRVLAALNKIGADVGDPIDVSLDTQSGRVLVRSHGVTAEREQQIARVLEPLPRVRLELNAAPSSERRRALDSGVKDTALTAAPLRAELESRFGSPAAFQDVADRTLDRSASLLARAHALEVLATTFSVEAEAQLGTSDRAVLRSLRNNHAAEMQRLLAQMRDELRPLLGASSARRDLDAVRDWRQTAHALMGEVRETDKLLSRLLAGSYARVEGEEMLRALPARLARLDETVRAQRDAGK